MPGQPKGIWGQLSLIAGSLVVGLAFAYAGPFIAILSIIASFIYGTAIMLRLITPKRERAKLKNWG